MIFVAILILAVLVAQGILLLLISSRLRTMCENTSGLEYRLSLIVREVSKGVVDPTDWEG